MAPAGAKVWVLEINESKRFEGDEVHIGGVFSSRENALLFLANEILEDSAGIEWRQSAHNEEFFEGEDTDGTEYQIYTTTVDGIRFCEEKDKVNCYLCKVDDPNENPFDPASHGICIIHAVMLWELAENNLKFDLRGSTVVLNLE